MEMFAVPNTVAPRSVTPSHNSQKRRDDNEHMSGQDAMRSTHESRKRPHRDTASFADRTANQQGMAAMSALARQLKESEQTAKQQDQAEDSRSVPRQQEARAKMMRDRLDKSYGGVADYTSASASGAQQRPEPRTMRAQQNWQADTTQPIHLVV